MSRIFEPDQSIRVKASSPHPKNTYYKVSIGGEQWDNNERTPVIKIQMVYNDKISGRRSPSYPSGTDDFDRVNHAVNTLLYGNFEIITHD